MAFKLLLWPCRCLAFLSGFLLCLTPALSAQSVTFAGANPAVNFGTVNICLAGQTTPPPCSATQTLTFNVTAGGTLGAPSALTLGAPNLDFTLASGSTCTGAVIKGNTCTVNVKFAPRFAGQRRGGVEVMDGSGNVLSDVPVYGLGSGPQVTFQPGTQSTLGSGDFTTPQGLAVDASGNIFVADASVPKEMLAADDYKTIKILGNGVLATDVAVDGSGNVFVADYWSGAVKEILAAGGYTAVKTLTNHFNFDSPLGVAVDGSGNIFVVELNDHVVYEILAAGGYTKVKSLGRGFSEPHSVAVDGSGNVFVADFGNQSVKEILAEGGYVTVLSLAGGFAPAGVALDGSGNVFVTDWSNNKVKEILATGGYTTVITVASVPPPTGIAVDERGNVYVANNFSYGAISKLDRADPPSVVFPTPTSIDFTDTADGAQTYSLWNSGNQPLVFTSGDNPSYPADFPKNSADTSLCAAGASLTPGASCDVSMNFMPTVAGVLSESLVLTDNALNTAGATQAIPLLGTGGAPSTPINFPNGFAGASSAFALNGGVTVNGTALLLTDGGAFENRSVFFPALVGAGSFSTEFDFQLTGEADGFTFVLQGNGPDAFGTAGGGLGYGPSTAGQVEPAITNSIAVKFDLHDDAGEGSSSTGLYVNGAAPTVPAINLLPSGIDLHSGYVFHTVLAYDGVTLTLTITDKATNATFTQTFPVDIPAILRGQTGFVGFTASTGRLAAVQKILDWQFSSWECCTSGEPSFAAGFPNATGLTLNYGPIVSEGALQLTNGDTFESASAFYSPAVPVDKFTSDFDFQLSSGAGDGFTFVLQSQGLNAIGTSGGGLGYGWSAPGGGRQIGNSVAVKFDVHNNAGEGSNSTGVYVDGASPTVPATNLTSGGIYLNNGHMFHARLSYDGTNLTVSITDMTEYAVFTQSYPMDIPAAVGGATAYPGFTAGTGAAANTETILNWTMTSY